MPQLHANVLHCYERDMQALRACFYHTATSFTLSVIAHPSPYCTWFLSAACCIFAAAATAAALLFTHSSVELCAPEVPPARPQALRWCDMVPEEHCRLQSAPCVTSAVDERWREAVPSFPVRRIATRGAYSTMLRQCCRSQGILCDENRTWYQELDVGTRYE